MSFAEIVRLFIDLTTRFVSPPAVAIEWVIAGLAALLVIITPARNRRTPARIWKAFVRFAGRSRVAVLACGLLPIAIRLALLGVMPVPNPSIHDEFSHLLLADTLAHGRLSNPTHPMWQHFESIHIIQQPTYASMYPPGQGAFLAVGQVLFHQPWAGVVLSVGLMCAAVCWMLQGWLPAPWALFGTLLLICQFGITGFWMNSYMGGAVAATGGALLIGSLPRLKRAIPAPIHSLLFGLGTVLLMNTRPFEGAFLTAAAAIYLTPYLIRLIRLATRKHYWRPLQSAVVPAVVVIACGFSFTAYYDWRVTGNPARMPYMVNRDTYGWPENLAFLPAKTVNIRHKVLRDMYQKEVERRDHYKTIPDILTSLDTRLYDNWAFLVGPVLTVPLFFFPWLFRNLRARPLIVFIAIIGVLNCFQLVLYPYHLGPVVPILFALIAMASRCLYLALSRSSRARGVASAVLLPAGLILVAALKQNAATLQLPLSYWERAAEPHGEARAEIEAWLSSRPRKQLVLVRYALYHSPDQEWVYNRADIDGSKVVWAREMENPPEDLLHYFADREVWLLEADVYPPHVVHYQRTLTPGQ